MTNQSVPPNCSRLRVCAFSCLVLTTAFLAVVALCACTMQSPTDASSAASSSDCCASVSNASDTTSSTDPTSSTSTTSSTDTTSTSTSTTASAVSSAVAISLDYNAGTGFEWTYAADPEGIVELVDTQTRDHAGNEPVAGGPLTDTYTFRAVSPGEVVLTFDLVRSWEGEPAETQVYAFTVSDNLSLVLNPYKSDFNNAPEWVDHA